MDHFICLKTKRPVRLLSAVLMSLIIALLFPAGGYGSVKTSAKDDDLLIFRKVAYRVLYDDTWYAEATCLADKEYSGEIEVLPVVMRDGEEFPVRSVGEAAFAFSDITSVILPDGLKQIKSSAFAGCSSLEKVYIPKSVKKIGTGVFSYCDNLELIEVDENNLHFTTIDSVLYTIDGKELVYAPGSAGEELSIPEGVEVIRSFAFEGNDRIVSVRLPETLEKICSGAFFDCNSLDSVVLGRNVSRIEGDSFAYCSLSSLCIDGDNAYYCVDDQKLLLDRKKKHLICAAAASGTVVIPDKVRYIDECSCSGNKKIEKLIIHSRVKSIGAYAFCDCSSLFYVAFRSRKTAFEPGSNVFAGLPYFAEFNIPYSQNEEDINSYKELIKSNSPSGAVITTR